MQHSLLVQCVEEENRIKVKIISPGYSNKLNCTFPAHLKIKGALYSIKSMDLKLSSNSKFYVIKNKRKTIHRIRAWPLERKIHAEETCVICLTNKVCCVLLGCGHLCFCFGCFVKYVNNALICNCGCQKKHPDCPICRTKRNKVALFCHREWPPSTSLISQVDGYTVQRSTALHSVYVNYSHWPVTVRDLIFNFNFFKVRFKNYYIL